MSATDWSTIAHLGADITRDIDSLRTYIRRRLNDDRQRASTWSRADRLAALDSSHLDETLAALLLCEHNLMTWERLRLARHSDVEPERLHEVVEAAQRALEKHRDDDQALVTSLEAELDELTKRRGLEGLVPHKRRQLLETAASLNRSVDWFAEQRTLDVTETGIDLPGTLESGRELAHRSIEAGRSATSRARSLVSRDGNEAEQAPSPEGATGDAIDG